MGGWQGVVEPREYFRYDSDWHDDSRRFEMGSLNHLGIAGMGASLQLLLDLGIDRTAERIFSLTGMLLGRLVDAGYHIVTPHSCREERSGIVTFVPGDRDPEQLAQKLENEGIIVSARGPCIRVSPHFYNTEVEIDRFLMAVGA
jgi:selenocysteine lyase/cysteine desulfurase